MIPGGHYDAQEYTADNHCCNHTKWERKEGVGAAAFGFFLAAALRVRLEKL
jgi:hypothetical protein